MERVVERYQVQSMHYLGNAFASIHEGDTGKASEFLWGSMAEALKAVAASRGIVFESHKKLWDYARGLAEELDDKSIYDVFVHANSLHRNFYESTLELKDVHLAAEDVRTTVGKLLSLILKED